MSASVQWKEFLELPSGMLDANALWLNDNLYLGGGSSYDDVDNKLYVYSHQDNIWKEMETCVYHYALASYNAQLVLIGGKRSQNHSITNKLWNLNNSGEFQTDLSPMPTKRSSASAIGLKEHLIVAGGRGSSGPVSTVEVYKDHVWVSAQSLPIECSGMKTAFHHPNWYLMGGKEQGRKVYYTSVSKLLISCQNDRQEDKSVAPWNTLAEVPFKYCSPAVVGNRLIATGGPADTEISATNSGIYAYSFVNDSWTQVGDMPTSARSVNSVSTVVLPTGEMVVAGGLLYSRESALAFVACLEEFDYKDPKQFQKQKQFLGVETKMLRSRFEPNVSVSVSTSEPSEQTNQELPGVEPCGETNFIIKSASQTFCWKGFGLQITIPEGALPAGVKQCTLNIKASVAGQYLLPDNCYLIQHCAPINRDHLPHLSIARSICGQELPYKFKKLKGGVFTSHSSYGCIKVKKFSGISITDSSSTKEKEYCGHLFYNASIAIRPQFFFVVAWNTDIHFTILKKYFGEEKQAVAGPYLIVEFENEEISLDFPDSKVVVSDCGNWTVKLITPPVVQKKYVDNMESGKHPYACQLIAMYREPVKPMTPLFHTVNLKGTKAPYNFFAIEYDPALNQTVSEATQRKVPKLQTSSPYNPAVTKHTTLSSQLPTANDSDDFEKQLSVPTDLSSDNTMHIENGMPSPDVQNLTLIKWIDARGTIHKCHVIRSIKHKWHEMGRLLGKGDELESISIKYQMDCESCCVDLLKKWLDGGCSFHYPVNWDGLFQLLDDLEFINLVKELRKALRP